MTELFTGRKYCSLVSGRCRVVHLRHGLGPLGQGTKVVVAVLAIFFEIEHAVPHGLLLQFWIFGEVDLVLVLHAVEEADVVVLYRRALLVLFRPPLIPQVLRAAELCVNHGATLDALVVLLGKVELCKLVAPLLWRELVKHDDLELVLLQLHVLVDDLPVVPDARVGAVVIVAAAEGLALFGRQSQAGVSRLLGAEDREDRVDEVATDLTMRTWARRPSPLLSVMRTGATAVCATSL